MDPQIAAVAAHYGGSIADTIRDYSAWYPEPRMGVNTALEWNRLAFAAGLARGGTVLDVGAGNGTLMSMLLRGGRFSRVAGVDIRNNAMRKRLGDAEVTLADITELPYGDGEFDTVFCMEVIEHLPPERVPAALDQLRRVARHRVVLTVPWKEPEPLFHHDKPTGHKQRFDRPKLASLFPKSTGMRLTGPLRFDWLMMVEDTQVPPGFRLLRTRAFCAAMECPPPMRVQRRMQVDGDLGRAGKVAAHLPTPLGRALLQAVDRLRGRA